MLFLKYLEKRASAQETAPAPTAPVPVPTGIPTLKDTFVPMEHQVRAIDKLYSNKGKLILAHSVGTGKTATSIYGFERLRNDGKATKALVVTPTGLRANFADSGVKKFTNSSYQVVGTDDEVRKSQDYVTSDNIRPDKDYTVIGYELFARDPVAAMQNSGADTLILDEFHKARNETSNVNDAVKSARSLAVNFMGLTGSPINNKPEELAELLSISEGKDIDPRAFKQLYTETVGWAPGFGKNPKKVTGVRNIPNLLENTMGKIDFVDSTQIKSNYMPKKNLQNVEVPMSDEQYNLYQLALDRLGPLKEYVTRRDANVTVKDAQRLFTQIAQARQATNAMNTVRADLTPEQAVDVTPKLKKILDDAEAHVKGEKDNQVVLYSNLVKGGVNELVAGLRARKIDPAIFVGKGTEIDGKKITSTVRQEGVKEYQEGKKRVIVLSGAGAEGLDLKDSTAFYALDGHFNPQRILQAEARAVRIGGQANRPIEKRQVDVRRYMSVPPLSVTTGILGGKKDYPQTTDEWIYNVAGKKFSAQDKILSAYKEPYRYIRKYKDAYGKDRYVYPPGQKQPGMV